MKALWSINLKILKEYYEMVEEVEKELNKELTDSEREFVFLELMKSKGIKPSGNTELNKEELIKEIVSKGKAVLNIDSEGIQIIKKKDEE